MADGFEPRFVDLVRSYTDTTGTADLVLGDAVPGFTSFASAVQPGDSFYYSVVAVENVTETEVGRGTLLADGSIKRESISGTATDFSIGTKTVALIAAAEWYNSIEGKRSAASAGSRAELAALSTAGPALLVETGHEGVFLFDPSDLSARVAADPAQGIYVPPASDPTGVSGAWVRKFPGFISVRWFGAKGDSGPDAVSGSDDTAAIQAAIDFIDSLGGGTLYFPEGWYRITSYLTLCKNLRVVGAGRKAAFIATAMTGQAGATAGETVRNGSAFYGNWPSNTSTPVHVTVEHIGFWCVNPVNQGAAFYDNCGTTVTLTDCQIEGFRYGVVFDQTELGDINCCEFKLQADGGAGVYLVNGPTLTPGNLTTVTNRISVTRCQINEYPDTYGILDEGGYTHSFIDNNYNGCLTHIYLGGVQAFQVIGGEFEASSGDSIVVEYRRLDGSGVGGSCGQFMGMLNSSNTTACIKIVSVSGPISAQGCMFLRGDGKVPITGASNAGAGLFLSGNFTNSTSGEFVDGYNGAYLSDDRIERAVTTNSNLASLKLSRAYAKKVVRCINSTGNQLIIQNDNVPNGLVPVGSTFELEQSTATGIVTLSGDAGVTISGPKATSGQFQSLAVRKVTANNWVSWLAIPDPVTAAISPVSVSATGPIGYAAGTGGTAVQSVDKSTAVALDALCGEISLSSAEIAAQAAATFTLTNNRVQAGDRLIVNHVSGGTFGAYALDARAAAGAATIMVRNLTAGPLSEPMTIGFAVIKAATS